MSLMTLLPPRRKLVRGLVISVMLWLAYLAGTAYTSIATLLDRVASTDVMKAAAGDSWQGRVTWEILGFVITQLLLHLAFALLCWLLACASAMVFETARKKFGRIVVGWFCLLAGAALVYNATWYPRTLIGAFYYDLASTRIAGLMAGQWIYGAAFALSAVMFLVAAVSVMRATRVKVRNVAAVATTIGVVSAGFSLFGSDARTGVASAAAAGRPNIIIIGVDSLRLEQLRRFGGSGLTPNLDELLESADLFNDATTPLARTFSSWTAILTGRAPPMTGARFNLAERSSVRATPTFADILRSSGYQTIYSTDEVRFANIDESFGFDKVVTPRIGASDFLIGTYNELPLASLFINNRIGRWLFPFSYANRGVATMFHPETYLELVRWKVSFDKPTLFISHLTAAHWPYYTGDTPFGVSAPESEDDRPLYRIGLRTADRMLGELIDVLRNKGALDNALVIVLSDHGEALKLPSDSFFDETFRVEGLRAPLRMDDYGHGQSVLSRSQYQVLVAFRTFGPHGGFGKEGRDFEYPVTVEDIAPTILEFAGVAGDPLAASGVSLLSRLESGAVDGDEDSQRIRFTETDLRVLPAPGGGVDEAGTARQNSAFFMVDPESGRLHIRASMAPLAVTFKERAAFTRDNLLAAIPAGPYAHQYILVNFQRKIGRLLLGRPDDSDRDAQQLWDALFKNYAGELKAAVAVTPADWPQIDQEWAEFAARHAFAGADEPSQAPAGG